MDTSIEPATSGEPPDTDNCVRDVAAMLRSFDRADLAAILEAQHRRPASERPSVVVVGETKRGKSSLVNALLGRPDLSPVDPDVATCVHITFRFAPVPAGHVRTAALLDPIEIDVADLADWASERGNQGNERNVIAIDVGLPAEILRHVTIVDTPGVGGLELGHAELTLQALGSADAILFVVDADNAITETELAFLERAAQRIDTVAIVLSKVDQYPGWRQIRDDNAALLARRAPRFKTAPMLPISSLNAERAMRLGSPELVRRERASAGLEQLESLLVNYVANRAHQVHSANTLRFCMRAIAEMRKLAQDQVAVAAGDDELRKSLNAEQARLAALSASGIESRRSLEAELAKLGIVREAALREKLDRLHRDYIALAKEQSTQPDLQRLAGQFVASLDAALGELAEQTGQHLVEAIESVIGDMVEDAEFSESVKLLGKATETPELDFAAASQKRLSGLEMFTAVTPVLSIDRLITIVPATVGLPIAATGPIGIAVGLVALAVGGGLALVFSKERKKIAARNSFGQWVGALASSARQEDKIAFGLAMVDARAKITTALDYAVQRRAKEVTQERARLEASLTESDAARAKAKQVAMTRVAQVDALGRQVRAAHAALSAQRGDSAPRTDDGGAS